jgi:3-oxoacyl-(acyl-carrier-protein) synthase III
VAAFITGSGTFLPERIVTNEEIAEELGLTSEGIFKSSGIRRRRWASPGTTTSSLAADALPLALEDAALKAEDIDYLLFGTMTPDRFIPGSATAVQKSLRLREIPCLDVRATCCNTLYALQLAGALVESGVARNVAICLAEIQSAWLDMSPDSGTTSMLFGDGAAALIVSSQKKERSLQILDILLASDGAYVDNLGIRRPGTEFGTNEAESKTASPDFMARMVGQSVILHASRKMTAACRTILDRNQLTAGELAWIVPHQANANILDQVARALQVPDPRRVVSVLEDLGNTSSASMGIALDTLRRSGGVRADDYLLLPAFGAGFTWGAALCKAVSC